MGDHEQANNDPRDKESKNKKIIDVLMDDDEWKDRKKIRKEKEEGRKDSPQPGWAGEEEQLETEEEEELETSKAEPQSEPKPETEPGIQPEREQIYLSEIEKNVLRAILGGATSVNGLVRATNYPEVVVRGAIERLSLKGYIDKDLNPTDRIRGLSLKRSEITLPRNRKFAAIDIAIIVVLLIFVISLLYYVGLFG